MGGLNKYSVVMPVHNGGHYFRESVNSILAQALTDFNLIVLDNKSDDGNIEWLENINNPRVIIYRSGELLTIENSWSRIKSIPKGEYMTMIGHDDILDKNYLAIMDNLIKQHPDASLYQSHFRYIDDKGRFIRKCLPMKETLQNDEFLSAQFNRKIDSTGTGYMMKSELYDKVGGLSAQYPKLIFADYELWLKLISLNYMAISRKECFSYRIHKSASAVTNGAEYFKAFLSYIEFLKNLSQDSRIKAVIEKDGYEFLIYYCESLSHRLLKTPIEKRNFLVKDLIAKFKILASKWLPGHSFEPTKRLRILAAEQLDNYRLTRSLFQLYKKFS